MSKHHIPINPVGTIHPEYVAPNNATVSPSGMNKVAQAFNYAACLQKKTILIRGQDHTSPTDGGALTYVWPHYFRTGENTSAVIVRYGAVLPDTATSTSVIGYALKTFSAGDSTDTSVYSASHDYRGSISAGAISPSQVRRRMFRADGLSANTEYHGLFTLTNSARLVFVSIHEELTSRSDDTLTGVCNPDKFHAEGPIYDEHAQDLTEANNKLWRHNGTAYFSWAPDYHSPPSTTGAALADIIGQSAGHYIDSTYDCTRNRTTVPIKMGVRAYASGTPCTADFRLTDGTNNIDITGCTLATVTSAKWFTTTSTIPAGTGTWRMQAMRASGAATVFIDGWTLFPYES